MLCQHSYILEKFGIDEIYIHEGFSSSLREKLYQRAAFSLDAEDTLIVKHASHDLVLVFYKQVPSQSLIYRFLKFLDLHKDKEDFIKSHTLIDEKELFEAIKAKNFIFVTHTTLLKRTHIPT